jgi:transcriptional regulator with XRE-family HTH domain
MQHHYEMKELHLIGKNISRIRRKKKFTQEDLCGLTEMDRSFLSEIENGKANPSIKTLINIATALDCKLTDLVEI